MLGAQAAMRNANMVRLNARNSDVDPDQVRRGVLPTTLIVNKPAFNRSKYLSCPKRYI